MVDTPERVVPVGHHKSSCSGIVLGMSKSRWNNGQAWQVLVSMENRLTLLLVMPSCIRYSRR